MGERPRYSRFRKDHWEILRRHPVYLELCDRVEFDERGFVHPGFVKKKPDAFRTVNQLAEEVFGIRMILDPKKDWSDYPVLFFLGLDDAVIQIKHPKTGEPPHKGTLTTDGNLTVYKPRQFIAEGKYLTVRVDLTRQKDHIFEQLRWFIDQFWPLVEGKRSIRRRHLSKSAEDFKVYDLIKEGKTPMEVAKTLWPKEYEKEIGPGNEIREKQYKQLCAKYERAGFKDFERRASDEVFTGTIGGYPRLYMRVMDKRRRVEKLLSTVERGTKT